ncbi:MAG: DUF47 family protein [Caldiserica bacterium]|jgi:predicted phosphate transport protein (TIGR00153 family)|nr:DUF47 family protein [Caldisericota bacterium]MDH7562219.1 DUF47 family protein [Caldisericota bacterium]
MKLNLFPKDKIFYELFSSTMEKMVQASQLLHDLFTDYTDAVFKAKEIKEVEHECDNLTHQIAQKVNQSFVTPIDREDIYALASAMDDVIDLIEATSDSLVLFSVSQPNTTMIALSEILVKMTQELKLAVDKLPTFKGIAPHWIEVHSYENQADDTYRKAISLLFQDHSRDPIEIIKLKEIYDILEAATDKAEDVATVLQNIVIKHS